MLAGRRTSRSKELEAERTASDEVQKLLALRRDGAYHESVRKWSAGAAHYRRVYVSGQICQETRTTRRQEEEAPDDGEHTMPRRMSQTRDQRSDHNKPETLNSVREDGWEEIELTVDSGASETVVGEGMIDSVEVTEGWALKKGVEYAVANGVRIPNLGEQRFVTHTHEGFQKSIKAQVCDVNKALLSVRRLVDAGNKVVFDKNGSYIEDNIRKEKMHLVEKQGKYVLKVWTSGAANSSFYGLSVP